MSKVNTSHLFVFHNFPICFPICSGMNIAMKVISAYQIPYWFSDGRRKFKVCYERFIRKKPMISLVARTSSNLSQIRPNIVLVWKHSNRLSTNFCHLGLEWKNILSTWSRHRRCSINRRVPKNLAKFTGKLLYFKNTTLALVLSCDFCKNF